MTLGVQGNSLRIRYFFIIMFLLYWFAVMKGSQWILETLPPPNLAGVGLGDKSASSTGDTAVWGKQFLFIGRIFHSGKGYCPTDHWFQEVSMTCRCPCSKTGRLCPKQIKHSALPCPMEHRLDMSMANSLAGICVSRRSRTGFIQQQCPFSPQAHQMCA